MYVYKHIVVIVVTCFDSDDLYYYSPFYCIGHMRTIRMIRMMTMTTMMTTTRRRRRKIVMVMVTHFFRSRIKSLGVADVL